MSASPHDACKPPSNASVEFYEEESHEMSQLSLEQAVLDLYLAIKICGSAGEQILTPETLEAEREALEDVNAFTILDYIKNSFDICLIFTCIF